MSKSCKILPKDNPSISIRSNMILLSTLRVIKKIFFYFVKWKIILGGVYSYGEP